MIEQLTTEEEQKRLIQELYKIDKERKKKQDSKQQDSSNSISEIGPMFP